MTTKFNTAYELVSFLKQQGKEFKEINGNEVLSVNGIQITFDLRNNKYSVDGLTANRKTSLDLTKFENHCVAMLVIKLLTKGYAPSTITLEKSWQTGHDPVYLDLMLKDPNNGDVYMIEVKTPEEYKKYTDIKKEKLVKQVCSYAMQEANTIIASYYTYDFDDKKDLFSNIYCKELRREATNEEDFFDKWNKNFDENDYIENNSVFNIKKTIKSKDNLKNIKEKDTQILFNQFETILRLNSISDKPTAFIKMINLFLSKLADEFREDSDFKITDTSGNVHMCRGLRFQYVDDEQPESFMKRLNELYKEGMKKYLNKDVIDYADEQILSWLGDSEHTQILKAFDNIRLKKDITFNFIEVFDDKTFYENFIVVRDIVRLLENFKFKYNTKYQFLGDFFESLLNTSLKQEAGQFFTPYPLVDFMVNSLDFKERIHKKLKAADTDFVPKIIDYACGAGHFLMSAMTAIQNELNNVSLEDVTEAQKRILSSFTINPLCWANAQTVVGIEKDYRLAKTTKIATFLNGDGEAEIISGDGINKFNCDEYKQTILWSPNNKIEKFDYVISNPPYSVDGFMLNFRKNGISKDSNTFTLLKNDINAKDSTIEIFFVERTWQLLKPEGIAAIVLPQSILSQSKYDKMRKYMFENFKLLCMLLTADVTFSGTTTSPVILFLKKEKTHDLNYEVLVHQSPKYTEPTEKKLQEKEEKFLGYKFSNNRNNSGTTEVKDSTLSTLVSITHDFISGKSVNKSNLSSCSRVVKLSDVLINSESLYFGDIYPKRVIVEGKNLSTYCKINNRNESDFITENGENSIKGYLEISDITTQNPSKKKKTTRFCKKGDILVSSLCPRASHIVIAKDDFMVTSAIHVLSDFENEDIRDKVFAELKSNLVLQQMNALLDGFKVTYAKISEKNLYNNIFVNIL